MSIQIDPKLLAVAVKGLGITVPIYSARKLKGGSVEVGTRDGLQVWHPPVKENAPDPTLSGAESVSKPRASQKRAPRVKKEVASEAVD